MYVQRVKASEVHTSARDALASMPRKAKCPGATFGAHLSALRRPIHWHWLRLRAELSFAELRLGVWVGILACNPVGACLHVDVDLAHTARYLNTIEMEYGKLVGNGRMARHSQATAAMRAVTYCAAHTMYMLYMYMHKVCIEEGMDDHPRDPTCPRLPCRT